MVIPIVFGKKSKIVDTGEVGDFVQSKARIPFHGAVYTMEPTIAERFGTYFHLDPDVFRFFFKNKMDEWAILCVAKDFRDKFVRYWKQR